MLVKLIAFSCAEIIFYKNQQEKRHTIESNTIESNTIVPNTIEPNIVESNTIEFNTIEPNNNTLIDHDNVKENNSCEKSKDSSRLIMINHVYDILLNLLVRLYNDELTKCSVISAIYKVFSTGGIDLPSKIQTLIEKYQQSKYTLIQEFSKLF